MDYKLIFVVVSDLRTGIDSAIAAALIAQQLDHVVAQASSARQRMQELVGQGREPSVVLLGPGIAHATAVARGIRAIWPLGQILFVASTDQYEVVQKELRYVPSFGPNWSLIPIDDKLLSDKLVRAVQASRQRARLRTTLDRANIRLAAPKAVDNVEYRHLIISEHYLASLLQHSSDAIFSLDERNNVLYWSAGAEMLFKFRPRYMQPAAELPFWSTLLDPLIRQIHEGQSPLRSKLTTVVDLQTLHLDVSLARVQDEDHALIGISIAIRDVSDIVRSLEAERAARQHAERLGRLKDEFLALLSHELRTPLSAVIGRTQLLRMQYRTATDLQSSLEIIERNAKLQAKLIEDLLDVSSIIAGKLSLTMETVVLSELVREAIESVQGIAEAKQLALCAQYFIEPDVTMTADAHRLQQVFYNILNNAIKFTPSGGTISVVVKHDTEQHAQIGIQDTGCGIAAEFLPHVFEKFGQEDASITRRHGGLGLGLSIAKQLTELHNGTISVASPGRGLGTSFTLRFPTHSLDRQPKSAQPPFPALAMAPERMLAQRSILLVEDVADTRELTRDVLRANGAHVVAVDCGSKALEILNSEEFDLLVSDIGMPDMDGYQLMAEVRRRGYSAGLLPAIALTAFASPLDQKKAFDAGFQAHLAKPHIVGELVTKLAEVLAQHGKVG